MSLNQNIERALLLIQQNRCEQAEQFLGKALAEDPQDGYAHSLLAICMTRDRDRLLEATREAEAAIHADPDEAFSYYAHSMVMSKRGQNDQALQSIQRAIELNPTSADCHGKQAELYLDKKKWKACLQSAETGLQFDPENEVCAAYRSLALERVGNVTDALAEADRAIQQNPDSSYAHANRGWALLNKGEIKESQVSFREALRLDPSNEFARSGMVSALNSNNFIFRNFYRFMLKMSRLDSRVQWGLIIGLWLGIRMLGSIAAANPWLQPWVMPISIFYLLFVMMSWIAVPLFNAFLRFHPFGKHLLSTKEKWASNAILIAIGIGIITSIVCLAQGNLLAGFLAVVFSIYMTIPLSIPFNTSVQWATIVAGLIAGFFGLMFLAIEFALGMGYTIALIPIYQFGILIYCFAGQALLKAEDRI